jgi:lipopolysaccharide export system permease protein
MPIYWRFLIRDFIKVFIISLLTFTLLIVVTRVNETAGFISLGVPFKAIILFIVYQLPYIIPIAIIISCLIASTLVMQKISANHELSAFFSTGFSLKKLLTPLITLAFFLSLINFYTVSEIATNARVSSKKMVQEITSFAPISLLTRSHLLKRKDCIIKTGNSKSGSSCKNVLIAFRKQKDKRITLFVSKEITAINKDFISKNSAFISSIPSKNSNYDHLILENQKEIKTSTSDFTQLFGKNPFRIHPDYLNTRLLLSKIHQDNAFIDTKESKQSLNKYKSELAIRLQAGISPLFSTILGLSFGLQIGRKNTKKNMLYICLITFIYFMCFFLTKSFDENFPVAIILLIFPIFLISLASFFAFRRIIKGYDK